MTVTLARVRLKEKMVRGVALVMLCALLVGCGARGGGGARAGEAPRVPVDLGAAVAVDQEGNVYATGGAGFAKWDAEGKPVYVIAQPGAAAYAIAVDQEYVYCAVAAPARAGDRQQIRRFRARDGRASPFAGRAGAAVVDGHLQIYDKPAAQIAAPLRAMDVGGSTLYVADAVAGLVRMFDTETGEAQGEFAVHLPQAVAVDPIGQIWVAHDRSTVRAFRADGYSGVTYGGLADVTALGFGPGGKLYAVDAKAGQVFTLDTTANPAEFVPVAVGGSPGEHGYAIRGVAADNAGNVVTIGRETGSGRWRVAKWSPAKGLLWERTVQTVNGAVKGP